MFTRDTPPNTYTTVCINLRIHTTQSKENRYDTSRYGIFPDAQFNNKTHANAAEPVCIYTVHVMCDVWTMLHLNAYGL